MKQKLQLLISLTRVQKATKNQERKIENAKKIKGGDEVFDWEGTKLYKGFVPNKADHPKEPAVSYTKEENHIDLKTAEGHNSFSGVLADNAALVESDDSKNSELLLKIIEGEQLNCLVTNREGGKGFHSLFFNNDDFTQNYTNVVLACGITVDIKIGKRNGLECLKCAGKERFPIYNKPPYQTAPKYFKPLKDCKLNFADMEAGDGRNTALFTYILTLQREGFTVEEIRECIRIINKYVLKEPVSEKELDVILRDGAFKKRAFFSGKTFMHDRFAEHIKNTYHIKKINGRLHIYKNGVYISDADEIERAMLKEISLLSDSKRKEVLKHLNLICDEVYVDDQSANLIAFRNGIYDLNTDTLQPFNPNIVITNQIPWDYNPAAYSELADKTLNNIACNDNQVRKILEECIGACFYRSNKLGGGKAFILTGEGSNGKSTFIEVIQTALGEDNYSSLDLKKLDAKFSTVMLFGKLANLGDDISDEFNPDVSVFKKIVTGNKITAEQKGQPEFQFTPFCKLVFSANTIPRIRDHTGAAQKRLLIIPFDAHFSKTDPNYDNTIAWKLKEQCCIEYFIRIGIEGLKRVVNNKCYSDSIKVDAQLEEYKIANNPVLSFIEMCSDEDIGIENEPLSLVYENYCGYCAKNNYRSLAQNEFSKQLQRYSEYKTDRITVKGRKIQILVKK